MTVCGQFADMKEEQPRTWGELSEVELDPPSKESEPSKEKLDGK